MRHWFLLSATLALGLLWGRGDCADLGRAAPALLAARSVASAAASAARPPAAAVPSEPLVFELNRGQAPSWARFVARAEGYQVLLGEGKARVAAAPPHAWRSSAAAMLTLTLPGSRKSAALRGEGPAGVVSYFRGGRPEAWVRGAPRFTRVVRRGVYPGIDLVYYGAGRRLEYDFVLSPYRDPRKIRVRFGGASGLSVASDGALEVRTGAGVVRQPRPYAYQDGPGGRETVSASYVLLGRDQVGFRVGRYDRSRKLVIDPVLQYGTLLGGSGLEVANAVAVDPQGNTYVTGLTTSLDFPTEPAAPGKPGKYGERQDAFVTKVDPTGTRILWSAYLGGGNKDEGKAITVGPDGSVYVTGATESGYEPANPPLGDPLENPGFPTTPNAFDRDGHANMGSSDAFVCRISPDGKQLLYSTYLGYGGADEGRGIAVDAQGRACVAGMTQSTASDDFPDIFRPFPTTEGAFQRAYGGGDLLEGDAFVTKLSADGSALVYSTYLGGSGPDAANAVALGADGSATVAGRTGSEDFPVTPGAVQTEYAGGGVSLFGDAFVARLNPSGTALVYSSFLGGGDADVATALALDSQGNAYVAGFSYSSELDAPFPVTQGAAQGSKAYDPYCPRLFALYDVYGNLIGYEERLGYCEDGFIAKLNAAGTDLVYSTYLGGNAIDDADALVVAPDGSVFVGGRTTSTNLPARAERPLIAGTGEDGYFAKLDPQGGLQYLSMTSARVAGLALAPDGGIAAAATDYRKGSAATPGAAQGLQGGGADAFVAKILDASEAPGTPASQLYGLRATGGVLMMGPNPVLFLLIDAAPTDPAALDVHPTYQVTRSDGEVIAAGQVSFARGAGFYDLLGLGVPPGPGKHRVRFQFSDGPVVKEFEIPAQQTAVAAPQPLAAPRPDGSLRVEWAPIPGARGHWVDLYLRVEGENGGGYHRVLAGDTRGNAFWEAPAGTLQRGGDYSVIVCSLDMDPRADPLPPSFSGSAGVVEGIARPDAGPAPSGDLDGNGAVNIVDVIVLLRISAGLLEPVEPQRAAGDLNQDGRLDIRDVLELLRRVAGLG